MIYLWSEKVPALYVFRDKLPHQGDVDETPDEVNLPDLVRKRVHMREVTLDFRQGSEEAEDDVILLHLLGI